MDNFNDFKKANYRKKVCASTEGGVVFFDPDSIKNVVGAEKMEYDEYLDVQIASLGKTRSYFTMCYFNIPLEFKGQVERITKDNICFERIFISGMFSDGVMFDGKEEHVWMCKKGFEEFKVGDCVQFGAEVYRYLKISNGKHPEDVVYLLRNKLKCGYCGKSIASESGTSSTGAVVRYYKCSTRKKDSSKCRKSMIRKEILEQLIVDVTLKVLNDPATIDTITERVFAAHEKRFADTSVVNILEAERDKIRKALNNMLNAVEQGIITSSTKQRIEELEAALEVAEGKILVEKSKDKVQITPADIKRFIMKALKKDPRLMIKLLVKEIILYDDKVEVYYNCIDKKRPDDLDHQAFCIFREDCNIDPKDFGLNYNALGYAFVLEMYF